MTESSRHRILFFSLLYLLTSLSSTVLATGDSHNADDIYRIELLVFRHPENTQQKTERWPRAYGLGYPENLTFLRSPPPADSHIVLPIGDANEIHLPFSLPSPDRDLWWPFDLGRREITTRAKTQPLKEHREEEEAALASHSDKASEGQVTNAATISLEPIPLMVTLEDQALTLATLEGNLPAGSRTLFHKSWRQQLSSREKAPAMVITGGEFYEQHYELEGHVSFSKQRYLHLEADLWLSDYIDTSIVDKKSLLEMEAQLPLRPIPASASAPAPAPAQKNQASKSQEAQIYQSSRIVQLRQHRKLRSNEIHYIDHPWIGIIVQISKYQSALSEPAAPQ